jgi:dipeptidyl-peptidase-3
MRKYLLEQIDDAAVVQYYADGFDALPLDQKVMAWHLSQAALAGRDIYYDQRYRHSLDMREVLEEILTHAAGVEPDTLTEIRRYAKLFWIHSGPHNSLTARKFVLKCSATAFRDAAEIAGRNGARFPLRDGESVTALVARLERPFFDAGSDAMVTNKAPGPGRDILADSANNLYQGVTMEDMEGFTERHGLNSRLVKSNGNLVEEVYRIGGRYDAAIRAIVRHLQAALPYAPPPSRHALEALVRWYETGDDADRAKYDVAWVQDKHAPIDTVNGFIENYLDPRGVKGAWEGMVFYVNTPKTESCRRLAEAAAWFEVRMPWEPQWRRSDVVGVTARAIDVIVETGEAGPVTAIGVNLPNDQRIREVHGSKSMMLANITEAYEKSQLPEFRREFCWSEEEVARAEKWGALAADATTAIHEVLGHGSGRVADRLNGQPQLFLKEHYSAVEEARADLVALYFLPERRLAEFGLVPGPEQDEVVLTEYEAYARNALVQLRRVREGTTLEEDHMRNRQMIVHWLMAETDAIEKRVRDGKTFYLCVNVGAFREGAGRLLGEIQRIKAEGDYEAAKALFERHGVHIDPALRDEIVSRVDRLRLPSYTAFVQPRLEAVTDAAGLIADVRVTYPLDLEQQMLEYSGRASVSERAGGAERGFQGSPRATP